MPWVPNPSACTMTASSSCAVFSRSRPTIIDVRNWCSISTFCGRLGSRTRPASQSPTRLISSTFTDPICTRCTCPGCQPPLRVEREADVRLHEQLLVALGLGEEVGAARLQVEHHVGARGLRGVDVGPDLGDLDLVRVVAVGPRLSGRDRRDDLEGRDDRHVGVRLVLRDEVLDPRDRAVEVLLAQGAERGGARGAVEGDHPPAGERELAASGQLNAGADDGEPLPELVDGPEAAAQGQHLLLGCGRQHRDEGAAPAGVRRPQHVHRHPGGTGGGRGSDLVVAGACQHDQPGEGLRRSGRREGRARPGRRGRPGPSWARRLRAAAPSPRPPSAARASRGPDHRRRR